MEDMESSLGVNGLSSQGSQQMKVSSTIGHALGTIHDIKGTREKNTHMKITEILTK